MSYWQNRKPVRRSRAVDIAEVAQASVALLDEGGLRSLTVRAVAHRLNVAPASLYSRITAVDDLFDLALDEALGKDAELQHELESSKLESSELFALMHTYYRHLARHPWACQVIAMRAPRGPNYLRLSERMCILLARGGSSDPLGDAYALSNFVIGSAATTLMSLNERRAPIDEDIAPFYASLHASHTVNSEEIVAAGLRALLR
ncbi:TetR/AcrR family transcriptional regulator [Actinomycetaceae bacterium L2_0104]